MTQLCIDGTPAGYYFVPAANASNKNDWQLYFEGGGWCYDEEDCTAPFGHSWTTTISRGFPALTQPCAAVQHAWYCLVPPLPTA